MEKTTSEDSKQPSTGHHDDPVDAEIVRRVEEVVAGVGQPQDELSRQMLARLQRTLSGGWR